MYLRIALLLGLGLLFSLSCQKDNPPEPPGATNYEVTFHNSFNILETQYAAFLSDDDGTVRAFKWIPGNDTAHLTIPNVQTGDRFDCTVVKIVPLIAPGTGVRDHWRHCDAKNLYRPV